MEIPKRIKNILEQNSKLNSIVTHTISQYDLILLENKLYFFEEYTDHGYKHIQSVIDSTDNLITDSTYNNILKGTPESVGVYILSVILHDIGMHLTAEGFNALINGVNDDIRITFLDKKTWKELWNEFLDEARRFGDKEKKNIIGNIKWTFKIPEIESKDKLTGEDKKLIGEFIRRHHPRIAHEIAINGFPINTNQSIPFASNLELDFRDICGIIARSHGVEIRSLFDYLIKEYEDTWNKPYNIEIVYLMVLLRIADYFQVDSSRTPEITVKLKSFKSPISQLEHYKHLDVKFVQPYTKDPETIIFQCNPRNSIIFIKLNELFKDIQHELDKSWAIIGEIYGKELKENQPKISFRRVKSNIDNVSKFSKKVDYIPEKINFNVSNELPKLLVGPLYGNDPTYGVRELLQNAVDSCREREFIEQTSYNGQISITIFSEEEKFFFRIEDNGLGMNLEILKNYFLEVGSSLRKSPLWKKTFSTNDGKSKVQRSGKFGIGVLAAFLIGDRINLYTKDSKSPYGLSFSTDLSSEQIEIRKNQNTKIGTTITIEITKEILDGLSNSNFKFDKWYTHESPIVKYEDTTGNFQDLGYKITAPGYTDTVPKDWHQLGTKIFDKVIWTYNKKFWQKSVGRWSNHGNLTCNGILIPEAFADEKNYYDNSTRDWVHDINLPYISIFDFDGNLPLNLSRNKLDGVLPFKEDLQKEIYNDVIAKLLATKFDRPSEKDKSLRYKEFYHPAIGETPIILSKEGFILKHNYFIKKNSSKTLLKISPKKNVTTLKEFDFRDSFIYIEEEDDLSMTAFQYRANIYNLRYGAKMFLSKNMYKKLFKTDKNRYPLSVRRDHILENENNENVELRYNNNSNLFSLSELDSNVSDSNYIIEMKISEMIGKSKLLSEDIFNKQLELYISTNVCIPYEIEKRKQIFSKAFKELKSYINKYIA